MRAIKKDEPGCNLIRPDDSPDEEQIAEIMAQRGGSVKRNNRVGKAERARVALFLRELRRYVQVHGSGPALRTDDAALNEAWDELVVHVTYNSAAWARMRDRRNRLKIARAA